MAGSHPCMMAGCQHAESPGRKFTVSTDILFFFFFSPHSEMDRNSR